MMLERALVKLLGYGVFWSRHSRSRFRANALEWILSVENFIFHSSLTPVPRSEGERLVERRVSIFRIPVSIRRRQRTKYRVALLVDEFFGGWDTAIGGYGALARKYICRFIPNDDIQIDVLLNIHGGVGTEHKVVDQTTLYRLPHHPVERHRWLDQQAYNLYLSIEMTEPSFRILDGYQLKAPLLYWIQDPRDLSMYHLRLKTVNRIRDADWAYIKEVTPWIHELIRQKRLSFISQGESLSAIAREMYYIPDRIPIADIPNPIEIDFKYELNVPPKENKIIFLGRLEAQKRVWIVCELAKAMPHYEFYILGATGKGRDEAANAKTLEPYRNPDGTSKIRNLHFTGHVDGNIKNHHIKTAKLMLNTSIWEGIPVSWLEALSYGTLIVSAFDRDSIVERFGTFVGEVMGDGTEEADIKRFTATIDYWMRHDSERNATARKAIEFVQNRHSIAAFTNKMRTSILKEIQWQVDSAPVTKAPRSAVAIAKHLSR
jgi:glycosyltransferase involved in cell wall biosynthesis